MTKKDHATSKIIKAVIVVILISITIIMTRKTIIKITYPQKYSEYVERYSKEYNVDEKLIYAIIKTESNFKQNVISSKDAIGLMQILESTAFELASKLQKEITKEDLTNPEINICLGTKYISNLIEKYGNLELAIASYNAGIGNVDSWIEQGTLEKDGTNIENIPFKETNNYVRKTLRNYKIYKAIYS